MHKILPLACFITALLAACATPRPSLTRSEQINLVKRSYSDIDKETVIQAVEKLLLLTDRSDFEIAHTDEGFTATRSWTIYLVLSGAVGTDIWSVKATESEGFTDVSVSVYQQSSTLAATPTSSGSSASITTVPSGSVPIVNPALYYLFWSRMDYLLGKSEQWITCTEADEVLERAGAWGDYSVLCNGFNIEDTNPETGISSYEEKKNEKLKKASNRVNKNVW